jgi:hypothetical protein
MEGIMKKNEDGNKLTTAILKGKGFKKEVQEDRDGDKFTTWYKDGLEIHQSTYSDDFSLATRTR